MSPCKSARGLQFSRLLAAEVCASAVVMLDTSCSEVVWGVLATHSISQFPLHLPSCASLCAITFQLESTPPTKKNQCFLSQLPQKHTCVILICAILFSFQYDINFNSVNTTLIIRWRERTNKMQLIRCLLSNFLSQHVSGIIMPIIRRIRPCPTACGGVLPGCVGCGLVELCALCESYSTRPQPTTATHPSRTPHAVGHGLILLMGIMMPETCWDRNFDNKHQINCILLVLSLHLMFTMHGHKNLKPTTLFINEINSYPVFQAAAVL